MSYVLCPMSYALRPMSFVLCLSSDVLAVGSYTELCESKLQLLGERLATAQASQKELNKTLHSKTGLARETADRQRLRISHLKKTLERSAKEIRRLQDVVKEQKAEIALLSVPKQVTMRPR